MSNSITPLKQGRLADALTELEAIIKPDAGQELPRQILYLGTPHLETSIYLRLVRERNYAVRFWPARYPDPNDPEQMDPYEGNLDPGILADVTADRSLVGEPTDPERFPHEDLLSRELAMTPASVQLQFQLNCRLSTLNKYPLRLGDLIVMDLDGKALPEMISWSSDPSKRIQDLPCVGIGGDRFYHRPAMVGQWIPKDDAWRCGLFVDPSGRGRDEMAWCVLAEYGGNFFLLEEGASQKGYEPEVLELLANKAKRWSCNICETESNYGDGMFTALLQPAMSRIWPLTVDERKVGSLQKERRIADILAPVMQQHRLVVSTELLRNSWKTAEMDVESGHERSLPLQISRLTIERGALSWDDRIDVLSFAVSHFTEAAKQDAQKEADARREAIEDAYMLAWLDESQASIDNLCMGYVAHPALGPVTAGGTGSFGGGVRRRSLDPLRSAKRRLVKDGEKEPLSVFRPAPRSSVSPRPAPGQ